MQRNKWGDREVLCVGGNRVLIRIGVGDPLRREGARIEMGKRESSRERTMQVIIISLINFLVTLNLRLKLSYNLNTKTLITYLNNY